MYQLRGICGATCRIPGLDYRHQESGVSLINTSIMTESPNALKRTIDWLDFRIVTDGVSSCVWVSCGLVGFDSAIRRSRPSKPRSEIGRGVEASL